VTLWRWHYSPEAVPEYRLYAAQPAELTRYYVRLIWGAMVLSFAGPALIWSLPRRFTRWAGTTVLLGLLFGLIGAEMLVIHVSPTAPKVRDYPINSVYFIFASAFAGAVVGYFRSVAGDSTSRLSVGIQKERFVVEGVIAWFAVLQFFMVFWLLFQQNAHDMEALQFNIAVPAILWTWFCSALVWKRRPGTVWRSFLWAAAIAMLLTKVVGLSLLFVGIVLHIPAAMSSWFVGQLELGNNARDNVLAVFLMFGPSLIWGTVMGLRRWQYLQAEPNRPPTVSAHI